MTPPANVAPLRSRPQKIINCFYGGYFVEIKYSFGNGLIIVLERI